MIHTLLSNIKWDLIFYKNIISNRIFREAMRQNKKMVESHIGETCFIVGNGPSIKNTDLSKLKDKFVFSVNDIYRNSKIFNAMNSDIHTVIDPEYAKMSNIEFDSILSRIIGKGEKKCYLCTTDFLKYDELFARHNIQPIYLFMHKNWCSNLSKINLGKNIYGVQNVVQACILSALCLGFKTIFVMGCEMTSFYENLEYNATGNLIQNHAHEVNEEDYKKAKDKNRDNAYMLKDYFITFNIFKNLNSLAKLYNAEIINLTPGGILDMFERKKYEDVF